VVASENGLQNTLGGMQVLKTNGLARLHNGDKPALSLGFKLLILFARNFLSVLYCPFPEATPKWIASKKMQLPVAPWLGI
jgi:hypothetical protein